MLVSQMLIGPLLIFVPPPVPAPVRLATIPAAAVIHIILPRIVPDQQLLALAQ